MERDWMYGDRGNHFDEKLKEFLKTAVQHKDKTKAAKIACPCVDCGVVRKYVDIEDIKFHLKTRGFMPHYRRWTFHGETVEYSASSSYSHDPRYTRTDHTFNTVNVSEPLSNSGVNDSDTTYHDEQMDDMLENVADTFVDRPNEYQRLLDASKTALYPTCVKYTKLTAILNLFNLKGKYGVSDKCFTALLELIHDMLPDGNSLPISTYEAKKWMCPMGVEYKKIHACPNNCVLYRGEYGHLDKCPKCSLSRYKDKDENSSFQKKNHPVKLLWYLPIIPRFKRLFANPKDAKNLRWHADGRKIDEKLRHPADGPQWRNINRKFKHHFGDEDRNLRLGLCTDGMNPYGTLSSQHSTWPVLLMIYNLPSWLCMKRKYIMLSLLISGPKQPGHNIDVYLAPLIEDLKLLWNEGTMVYDAHAKENFTLKALLFCTVNDFPAYGNLSGYTVKGFFACPICEDDTSSDRLKHCGKNVYMCHRRFLPVDHPYRSRKRKLFNNEPETRVARPPLTSEEVYAKVKDIENVFGNTSKPAKNIWKKRSIFWDLPYWRHLPVRHCLDIMHIVKNVGEAVGGTLLNIPGKTKDGLKVRRDMQELGIRKELHPQVDEKRTYLPPACYTLSKSEKIKFCKCLHSLKVPSGYSSNWKNIVSMKDLKLLGMKSHDYHVLMLHLLPVAIRGILPDYVRNALTRLCFFFNAVCCKAIDSNSLDDLQHEIVVTICQLEMYFPPSFFDIMVHLVVHIVREIKLCGPVYLRYMYPFERYMGILKGRMKNRYRPEGSIIEATVTEEVTEFVTSYLNDAESIGIPKPRHHGRFKGKGVIGKRVVHVSRDLIHQAHLFVLQHLEVVEPYFDIHIAELRQQYPTKNHIWLKKEQNRVFIQWFKVYVFEQASLNPVGVSEEIRCLAVGPGTDLVSFEGYDINGCTYYTSRQDVKSIHQNSGVKIEASVTEYQLGNQFQPMSSSSWYYGVIEDIWELDYHIDSFLVFRCNWADNRHGYQNDEGLILVDLSRFRNYKEDQFVFGKDCDQVFYVEDPKDSRWSVVLPGRRPVLFENESNDDDDSELEDETILFHTGLHDSPDDLQNDDIHTIYARSDHDEGVWVENTK